MKITELNARIMQLQRGRGQPDLDTKGLSERERIAYYAGLNWGYWESLISSSEEHALRTYAKWKKIATKIERW